MRIEEEPPLDFVEQSIVDCWTPHEKAERISLLAIELTRRQWVFKVEDRARGTVNLTLDWHKVKGKKPVPNGSIPGAAFDRFIFLDRYVLRRKIRLPKAFLEDFYRMQTAMDNQDIPSVRKRSFLRMPDCIRTFFTIPDLSFAEMDTKQRRTNLDNMRKFLKLPKPGAIALG